MDLDTSRESESQLTDEEDCDQDGDMEDGGRRRRFCNERAQQKQQQQKQQQPNKSSLIAGPSQSSNKRRKPNDSAKSSVMSSRYRAASSFSRKAPYPVARGPLPRRSFQPSYGTRTKRPSNGEQRCTTKKVFNTTNQPVPHDTVIHINPLFIKRFLKKAMIMQHATDPDTKQLATSMADDSFSFKQSPEDALQAAATMAIIRLVTECIEVDLKRDEKANKILAGRLMQQMKEFAKREPDSIQTRQDTDLEPNLSSNTMTNQA
jgi:hypothetical protein